MGVPMCSRMTVRRAASRSRALVRKGASPSRSVSAVESTISAKRMTAVPEGVWSLLAASSSSSRNASIARTAVSCASDNECCSSICVRRAFGIVAASRLTVFTETSCSPLLCITSVGHRTCERSSVASSSLAARMPARNISAEIPSVTAWATSRAYSVKPKKTRTCVCTYRSQSTSRRCRRARCRGPLSKSRVRAIASTRMR